MIRTEEGAVVGSIDRAALEAEQADSDDLSKLLKADLVELAEAAGVDTDGLTKAELVEAIEASEED